MSPRGAIDDGAVCDPPQEIKRIWARFVASQPVRWYLRYGWKQHARKIARRATRG